MTLSGSPAARSRAQARWSALADRFRSVTPSALGRGALAATLLTAGAWVSFVTWPALLPFLAGAILAYTVLPVANRLDRYMPRVLAALIAEGIALAVLLGVAVVVIPPLVRSLVRVALLIPSADQVQAWLTRVQAQLGTLPDPLGGIVTAVLTETAAGLTDALDGLVAGAGDALTQQVLGFLGTATFVVGLLVIPAWILTVVADERTIKRRAAGFVAPAVRTDVVAGFRIIDRALATFLRTQVLVGVATGALTWVGLEALQALGVAEYPYSLAGAVLLGSLQLIPQLGFFLGLFPIALVLALAGPVPALGALVVYMIAARIAMGLLQGRLSKGVLDVHPALLIPAIVVLSEFGLIWLLAAAPVVAITRDLSRYIAARLDDPPSPAGVLPGDRRRGTLAAPPASAIPSVYRDRAAPRSVATVAASAAPARSQLP